MERAVRANSRKSIVVDSAVSNFTLRGYHGTSMRDIASDAGVTVASIYHHFPSKQEILREIMAQTLSDALASTRSALATADPAPTKQLRALVEAWVRFHTSRQPEALIGASELRSLDEEGRRLIVALRDEQERMFRDVIERGVQMGDFSTPFPRDAARAVIHMGQAVASWYRPTGQHDAEELGRRYAELALAAVRALPTLTDEDSTIRFNPHTDVADLDEGSTKL